MLKHGQDIVLARCLRGKDVCVCGPDACRPSSLAGHRAHLTAYVGVTSLLLDQRARQQQMPHISSERDILAPPPPKPQKLTKMKFRYVSDGVIKIEECNLNESLGDFFLQI